MNYLIYISIAITSFLFGWKSNSYFKNKKEQKKIFEYREPEKLNEMRNEAKEALTERTENRKDKILDMMKKEEDQQKKLTACNLEQNKKGVTCNDIEKFLDVSGQTALKYLNELEEENKINQIGKRGKGVYYILK